MNTAIEERIRNRAYELWEAEGRPQGREIDHWLQAVQELAAEKRPMATASARRPRTGGAAPATGAKSTTSGGTGTATARRTRTPKGTASLS